MKTTTIAFSAASVLLASLFIVGTLRTGVVAALTATTTSATVTDAEPTIILADTSSSTLSTSASSTIAASAASTTATSTSAAPLTDSATSTANASSATSSVGQTQGQGQRPRVTGKPPLKRVHVVGSKYVDFFTDGTTTYSFPGDPLRRKSAPSKTRDPSRLGGPQAIDVWRLCQIADARRYRVG
jgi:hypothetical protein